MYIQKNNKHINLDIFYRYELFVKKYYAIGNIYMNVLCGFFHHYFQIKHWLFHRILDS